MLEQLKQDKGAVLLIEAAFVFPMVVIIVLIMVMLGNAEYQKTRVTRVVMSFTMDAAEMAANPMLESVIEDGAIPTVENAPEIEPYRYLFSTFGVGEIETQISNLTNDLYDEIEGLTSVGFKSMEPTNIDIQVEYEPGVLMSTIVVQCNFSIEFPIRMLFADENFTVDYAVRTEQCVGDPAEFVRNVGMVKDYAERVEWIADATDNIKGAIDKVAEFLN